MQNYDYKLQPGIILLSLVVVGVVLLGGGIFWFTEYKKLDQKIAHVNQLADEEKYDEAIETLGLAQVSWFVKTIGVKEEAIESKLQEVTVQEEHQSIYEQGFGELRDENWQESIDIFSTIPEGSFYYHNAQLRIEESKRGILEGELTTERRARQSAEQIALQEEQTRKIAEQKAQDETLKRVAEEKVRKQAEETAQEEMAKRVAEERARQEAEQGEARERLAKEQQQREAELQRQRAKQEEKARILEEARTNPLVKAVVSGELKFYIEPLPSYAGTNAASTVETVASDFSSWSPYGATIRRVYNSGDADLTISWVQNYGTHTIGEAIFRAHVKVGLGTNNCLGEWRAFDASTIAVILWHELGHSMGYGHSSDSNNVMHGELSARFEKDSIISEVISGGWYQAFPLCGSGTYAYSFETASSYTGFNLYVLPPGQSAYEISGGTGNYYSSCSAEKMHTYSNSCTVASGAKIYIGNTSNQEAIRLNGEIIDMDIPPTPDLTWDQSVFQYDSNKLMQYWELFH